jgi:hypothetical protein
MSSSTGLDMSAAEDLRHNARECIQMARRAANHDSKLILLELAQVWLRLAADTASIDEPHELIR